ncbi:MAG TPA: SDR family oxidoreductase [Gemmatimonadaceae bacterium]|nr:SDR family oxidoreductase [Gemmatimonadaceae bacterium]
MRTLEGRVAVVAGATRGAGRGIAVALGERGATVYCTGRSIRGQLASGPERPETIEETAERVTAAGGKGIAVRVDHTVEEEVRALCDRVKRDAGHLDVLVNDVWGGDALVEFGKTFWEVNIANGRKLLDQAIWSHIVTSHYAAPLMFDRGDRGTGLIVEVTDGDFYGYRGNIFYDLVKSTVIRLAFIQARELRKQNVAAVAVTPGFLRSEMMLQHFGVTEENWRDGGKKDPHFLASETPLYVGRAVAALASDPNVKTKSGKVFASWTLAHEYGFTDADGSRPDWGAHFEKAFGGRYRTFDDELYALFAGPGEAVFADWP